MIKFRYNLNLVTDATTLFFPCQVVVVVVLVLVLVLVVVVVAGVAGSFRSLESESVCKINPVVSRVDKSHREGGVVWCGVEPSPNPPRLFLYSSRIALLYLLTISPVHSSLFSTPC
jgi:hypothetical protein